MESARRFAHDRSRRATVLVLAALAWLVFLTAGQFASAKDGSLFIYPPQAAPGAIITISGPGFTPDSPVQLTLICEGNPDLPLPDGQPGADGRLMATTELHDLAPGACLVQATDTDGNVRETTFAALPAIIVELNPPGGPPGTEVEYLVDGLVDGQMMLLYNGIPVVYPMTVGAGVAGGMFKVPTNVPNDSPDDTHKVEAVNLRGGRSVGRGSAEFAAEDGPLPPVYEVADLEFSVAGLLPGDDFSITGQIIPTPDGPPGAFYLVPIWRKPDGRTFPVSNSPAQIALDGSFSVMAHLPSLPAGDPETAEPGDSLAVILMSQNSETFVHETQPDFDFLFPSLKIKVVDATTQQPISGAMVSFLPWGGSAGAESLGEVANSTLPENNNQLSGAIGQGLTPAEQWQVLMEKAMCIPQPIPVNLNPLEMIDPTIDLTLLEPSFQSLVQGATEIINGAGLTAAERTHNNRIHYLLSVDAIQQGYGQVTGNALKAYGRRIDYDPATFTYYDADTGAAVPNPLTVKLTKAPTGVLTLGKPALIGFEGVLPLEDGDPNKPPFGTYYSLLNLPNTTIPAATSTQVKVHFWPLQYNQIQPGSLKLYLNGTLVDTFDFTFRTGILCDKFKGYQGQGPSYYDGAATLPNLHKRAPGNHTVRLSGQLKSGETFDYFYEIRIHALPPDWFATPSQGPRVATWTPGGAGLRVNWLTAAANTQVLNTEATNAETLETGALYNRTRPNARVDYEAKASGYTGAITSGGMRGEVINRQGGCRQFGFNPMPCALTGQAADEQVIDIAQSTEVVVPEVTYNIPGFAAGIPLVAYVIAGGKISYQALLTYEGQVTVKNNQTVESEITMTPWAEIVGGLWLHDYIAGGVIHTGKVELDVGLHVGMPIIYNSVTGIDTGDMCFRYFSELTWYSGEICDPTGIFGGGCAIEDKDTETLFSGYKPSGCTLPPKPDTSDELRVTSDELRAPAADDEPPLLGTDMASNGFGTIMAVWQHGPAAIGASAYNGLDWSDPQIIPAGRGAHDPHVAFTDIDQAVVVWTETDLTDDAPPDLTVEDAIRARRIAAAVWDSGSWLESMPLTESSLGEGGVALAGCPLWRPECAEGGVAAVAVWERNLAPDLDERRLRLYTAFFTGEAWSTPAPLLPDGPETDSLPQVAFLNGEPVVAWVRDTDADLTDNTSRRLAVLLPGATTPALPSELPDGIGEIAMAVDRDDALLVAFTRAAGDGAVLFSNERPLWLARGVCGRTSCAWQAKQIFDPLGRALYAEGPVVSVNEQNQAVITFRGTGFDGSLPPQPLDAPGMASGFGDLAQVVIAWPNAIAVPTYLSADGAVNWLASAAYDPVLDNMVAMAAIGAPPSGLPQTRAATLEPARQDGPLPDLPLLAAAAPALPDLAVVDVVAESPYILPGDPPRVTVRVQNSGVPLPDEPGPDVVVLATWDGGPGDGAVAAQGTLNGLGARQAAEFEMTLAYPSGADVFPHTLTVTVNPWLSLPESDLGDNSVSIPLGGVAGPRALAARVRPGGSLVFLSWPPVDDERVAGYRVYRQDGSRLWRPVGSAFGEGWVDLAAVPGETYAYAVAAYTFFGYESPRAEPVVVDVPPLPETPPSGLFLPVIQR